MRIRTAIRGVCALALALALTTLLPRSITVDPIPWQIEVAKKYAEGGYAIMESKVYKIGQGSRMTSTVFGYVHRQTSGFVSARYMFIRCGGFKEVLLLSPSDNADSERLEKARFVKPGSLNFRKIEEFYTLGCKEMLPAKQYEIMEEIKKLWSKL